MPPRKAKRKPYCPGYSARLARRICDRVADGESIRGICLDKKKPIGVGRTAIRAWLKDKEGFAREMAIAREFHADDLFEELKELEDTPSNTALEAQDKKIKIASIHWRLSRMHKKYGDTTRQEIAGEGPDGEVMHKVIILPPAEIAGVEKVKASLIERAG